MANKRAALGRPLPDASVSRNCFDRGYNRSLHYSVGMAVPSHHPTPLIAGSHSKINRKIFQRTNDVYTSAFTPIDTHMQFYFVPVRQLMSEWDDMKLNIQDFNTSFFNTSPDPNTSLLNLDSVPWCTLGELKAAIDDAPSATDPAGLPFKLGALRLLDLMGYGNYYDSVDYNNIETNLHVNLLKLMAYQKVYFDHFRNTAYESNNPLYYNMDYYRSAGYHVTDNKVLRGLLTLRYVDYRKDYFQSLYPSLNYVASIPSGADWTIPSWVVGAGPIPYMIQAEIDGDSSSITIGDPTYSVSGFDTINGNETEVFIQGTRRGYVKSVDFSTSNPSNLAGVPHDGGIIQASPTQLRTKHSHSVTGGSVGGTVEFVNPLTSFGVQQIRGMFALDKLMRASAYAPKHAKEQYEARYGIKFKSNPNESIFVGAFMNDVVINQVLSTANTAAAGGDTLGAIGGMGIGSSDYEKFIEFDNNEDGFLVPIIYSLPRTAYSSHRIDAFNLKETRDDFFIPEFMDLGLRPMTWREFYNGVIQTNPSVVYPDSDQLNAVMGYHTPYLEYKIGIDENTGLFANNNNELSKFVINSNDPLKYGTSYGADGVTYNYFKVKPYDVDNIFVLKATGEWEHDHMLTYVNLSLDVNQNMSVHGQPRLANL